MSIILTNQAFMPIKHISWQDAACLIFKGDAENLLCGSPVKTIHGASSDMDIYEVVFRTSGLIRPVMKQYASRMEILTRDHHRCAYCGEYGSTIDHIFPKSRGGGNTFQNLITACAGCNEQKMDRTPEEAGMSILFPPLDMDPRKIDQMRIQELFSL